MIIYDNVISLQKCTTDEHYISFQKMLVQREMMAQIRKGKEKESYEPEANSIQKKKTNWKANITCHNCGKKGHLAKECRNPKKKEKKDEQDDDIGSSKGKENSNQTKAKREERKFSPFKKEANMVLKNEHDKQTLLLDCGSTDHFVPNKGLLYDYEDLPENEAAAAAKGTTLIIVGKGKLRFVSKYTQKVYEIENVFHATNVRNCLLSVGRFNNDGLSLLFPGNSKLVNIMNGTGETICQAYRSGPEDTLFPMMVDIKYPKETNQVIPMTEIKKVSDSMLMHQKLGHIGSKAMKETSKVVEDFPPEVANEHDYDGCHTCILAKMTRAPMPKKGHENDYKMLDVVACDLIGPFPVSHMLPHSTYAITFMDVYSHFQVGYILPGKDIAKQAVEWFCALAANQHGRYMKTLVCDGGTEFDSSMQEFCKRKGILIRQTPRYTPELNGKLERNNRVTKEKIQAMLTDSQLPKALWADAFMTAIYQNNLVVSRATKEALTPYELWNKVRPSLKHLHVFGCLAYVQTPKEIRRALDDKAQPGVFVGYHPTGYRIYIPSTNRTIVSCHVKFYDNVLGYTFKWEPIWKDNVPNIAPLLNAGQTNEPDHPVDDSEIEYASMAENDANATDSDSDNEYTVLNSPMTPDSNPENVAQVGEIEEVIEPEFQPIEPPIAIPEQPPVAVASQRRSGIPVPSRMRGGMRQTDPRRPRSRSPINTRSRGTPAEPPAVAPRLVEKYRRELHGSYQVLKCDETGFAKLHSIDLTNEDDNPTIEEAMKRHDWDKWKEAIEKEYNSLIKNGTWEEVPASEKPADKTLIKNKWVLKLKRKADGSIDKYKAAKTITKRLLQSADCHRLELYLRLQ